MGSQNQPCTKILTMRFTLAIIAIGVAARMITGKNRLARFALCQCGRQIAAQQLPTLGGKL